MRIINTIEEFRLARRECCQSAYAATKRRPVVGFVPTMGNLHEGHRSLILRMRAECEVRLVSIFVNPVQFGTSEDYEKYPRTLEQDAAVCAEAGVDIVFAPWAGEMYQEGHSTSVSEGRLSQGFCGRTRMGHFDGVALVVAKLFNIARPDRAYFGQKDFQQYKVVERIVRDLDFQCELVICPTEREKSGLAMSSRNAYLTPAQHVAASTIYAGLYTSLEAYKAGERRVDILKSWVRSQLDGQVRIEYLEIASPDTLGLRSEAADGDVILIAARVGNTRLIDNLILTRGY